MPKDTILTGDESIMMAALQRAREALASSDAVIAVGFAEGLVKTRQGIFTAAWCAAVTRDGRSYLGGGFNIPLSDRLLRLLVDAVLSEADIEKYISDFDPNSFEVLTKQVGFAMKNAGG